MDVLNLVDLKILAVIFLALFFSVTICLNLGHDLIRNIRDVETRRGIVLAISIVTGAIAIYFLAIQLDPLRAEIKTVGALEIWWFALAVVYSHGQQTRINPNPDHGPW